MNKILNLLLLSILVLITNPNSSVKASEETPYQMTVPEFVEIKMICTFIHTHFKPEENFYLGVGRSIAPFAIYLEKLAPDSTSSFALSSFSDLPTDPTIREKVFAYFDTVIPSHSVLKDRKILVFDYSITGDSMQALLSALRAWSSNRGRTIKFVGLALLDSASGEMIKSDMLPPPCEYAIDLKFFPEIERRLERRTYTFYSPHSRFEIFHDSPGKDILPEVRQAQYYSLRRAIESKYHLRLPITCDLLLQKSPLIHF